MNTSVKPEMRLDPLRQTWTVFSPARLAQPQFASRNSPATPPDVFSPAHERILPPALLAAETVRVIPNRAPALQVEGSTLVCADGFYDRMDGVGAHEVIIETAGEGTLESLRLPEIASVIAAWKSRMLDLIRDVRMRSFFVLKNVGEPAGGRVGHSVSQLIALAVVPAALKQKLRTSRDFYERKKRSIFDDILREELRVSRRIVHENAGFIVFCPYASRVPFELAIYPKRQCPDFHATTEPEVAQLADALKTALLKIDGVLDSPAYHLALVTAPTRSPRRDYWNTIDADFRWHIEISPRLSFPDGLDFTTGAFFNTVLPETASEFLRNIQP